MKPVFQSNSVRKPHHIWLVTYIQWYHFVITSQPIEWDGSFLPVPRDAYAHTIQIVTSTVCCSWAGVTFVLKYTRGGLKRTLNEAVVVHIYDSIYKQTCNVHSFVLMIMYLKLSHHTMAAQVITQHHNYQSPCFHGALQFLFVTLPSCFLHVKPLIKVRPMSLTSVETCIILLYRVGYLIPLYH